MEKEINIVTTVDGEGVVEAQNDLVRFTLSLKSKNESLEGAKRQVKENTVMALKELESLKDKGMKLENEIEVNLSNYKLEHREGGEKFPAGFQSINTISFTAIVNDSLNEINTVCLKLDPNMARPIFSIKDRDTLLEKAIQKASDNVKTKLSKECSLLNVSSDKLKILNWNFGYEGYLPVRATSNNFYNSVSGVTGPQGPVGYYGSTSAQQAPVSQKIGSIYLELLDPVKLDPGNVSVKVVVQVNYVWKPE